jgi:D-alanyl-D-alanine carboxypeptidase
MLISGCVGNNNQNTTNNKQNDIKTDLQFILDKIVASKDAKDLYITGIPLAFQCNGVVSTTITSGKIGNEAASIDLPNDTIYQIGSSTKSFTAVIALQLEAEGLFGNDGLNSTIGAILKNPPSNWNQAWNRVTLRQLLNMTSGIHDYVDEVINVYFDSPNYNFITNDLLGYVANMKFDFEPGTSWSYSNTNYVIMNEIIQYVTNQDINFLMQQRIFNKLQLAHTYYAKSNAFDAITDLSQRALLMRAYWTVPNIKSQYFQIGTEVSEYSLSIMNAAGSIISDTNDMTKYIHALFIEKEYGGLLERKQLNELTSLVATESTTDGIKAGQSINDVDRENSKSHGIEGFGYGLGVMKYFKKLSNGSSVKYFSHGGDSMIFHSNWIYQPDIKLYMAYALNNDTNIWQNIVLPLEAQLLDVANNKCTIIYGGK